MKANTVNNTLRKFERLWLRSFFSMALLVTESADFLLILYHIKVIRFKILTSCNFYTTVIAPIYYFFLAVLGHWYDEVLSELFSTVFTATFDDYPETLRLSHKWLQRVSNSCPVDHWADSLGNWKENVRKAHMLQMSLRNMQHTLTCKSYECYRWQKGFNGWRIQSIIPVQLVLLLCI